MDGGGSYRNRGPGTFGHQRLSSTADISSALAAPADRGPAAASPPPPAAAAPPTRQAFKRATRALPAARITPRRLMVTVGILLLGIFVCRDAWKEIFLDYAWPNEDYSHIFFAPLVAGLLVYVRRLRLRHYL